MIPQPTFVSWLNLHYISINIWLINYVKKLQIQANYTNGVMFNTLTISSGASGFKAPMLHMTSSSYIS